MKTVFKTELYLTRKSQFVWLGTLLLLDGFCYFEFLSLKDSLSEMAPIINQLPRIMMIMFGVRMGIDTALGWYTCLYYWIGLLAFAYAMSMGLSCVAKECRTGTAEYLFTKPVSRRDIVLGKTAASIVSIAIFSLCAGVLNDLLLIRPMGGLAEKLAPLTTTIGLFLTQVVLFGIGLFISALARRPKLATRIGVVVMLSAYAVMFAAQYAGISWLSLISLLCWFDVLDIIQNGFRFSYILLAVSVFLLCMLGSLKGWTRREL